MLLWAAIANTIPTCYWVLYYILKDTAIKQRVLTEMKGVEEGADGKLDTPALDKLLVLF